MSTIPPTTNTAPLVNGKTFAQASTGVTDKVALGKLAEQYQAIGSATTPPVTPTVTTPVTSGVTAPTTVDSSNTAPTPPVVLPDASTPTASDALGGMVDSANTATKTQNQKDEDAIQANLDSGATTITDLMKSIGNEDQLKETAYAANGVDDAKKAADDYSAQIDAEKEANTRAVQKLQQSNPQGLSSNAIQAKIDEITRDSTSKQADLAILQAASQNKYATASAIADRQVEAQLEPMKAQLDAAQFLYDNNKWLFDKADAKVLSDQQREYDDAKQNADDIKNLKLTLAKNGAPASVLNTLTNTKDLNTALNNPDITQYFTSASDKLDLQLKRLQIAKASDDLSSDTSSVNGVPSTLVPYLNTSNNGVKYIDASALQGTADEKSKLVSDASKAGLKVIFDKDQAADLTNIQDVNSKIQTIKDVMNGITQPNALSRDLGGIGLTKLSVALQSDPQKVGASVIDDAGLDILKAISGIQGFKGNAKVIAQIQENLPTITDTKASAAYKLTVVQELINDRENAIVGKAPETATDSYFDTTVSAIGTTAQTSKEDSFITGLHLNASNSPLQ